MEFKGKKGNCFNICFVPNKRYFDLVSPGHISCCVYVLVALDLRYDHQVKLKNWLTCRSKEFFLAFSREPGAGLLVDSYKNFLFP